jgi:peptidoglycan/xylan/chitin deacetylase (PgdA/CDA1 family)
MRNRRAFIPVIAVGENPLGVFLTEGVTRADIVCAFVPLNAGSLASSLVNLAGGSPGSVLSTVVYSPYYGWVSGGGQGGTGSVDTGCAIGLGNTALLRFSRSSGIVDLFGAKETNCIIAVGTYQGKDFICGTLDNTVAGAITAGVVGIVTEANGSNALGYVDGSLVKTFVSGYTETPARSSVIFGSNSATVPLHVGQNCVQAYVQYNKKLTTPQIAAITAKMNAIAAPEAPQIAGSVLLTFDDCVTSLYTVAFPYMASKGLVGTAYAITDRIGTEGYCTWEQLQEMAAAGWKIGNHTKTHPTLTTLTEAEQEAQFTDAKNALIAHSLSDAATFVAYPGGGWNADTLTAMQNTGMQLGRLYDSSAQQLFDIYEIDKYKVPSAKLRPTDSLATATGLVDSAVSAYEVACFVLHDIAETPSTYGWSTASFQGLVDYIATQGVPCLTINQLYALRNLW